MVMVIRNRLAVLACLLLFVSAAIHLSLGIVGLSEAATTEAAILPGGYLLAALAAFVLLAGYATGRLAPVTTYALGAGLATLLVLAYADVHAFGHVESAFGLETHGGGHGGETAHGHADGGHGHDHPHVDGGHAHAHAEHAHEHGHGHDEEGTLAVLSEHLRGDAYALVSKAAEAAAAVCFATLAVLER